MIHNNSNDPVLIKKISLKIWSLRDEIEARIQEKIGSEEIVSEQIDEQIKELKEEYTQKHFPTDNVYSLNKSGADQEAAEEDKATEVAQSLSEAEENESKDDQNNLVKLPGEAKNVIQIKSEVPPLLSEEKIARGKTVLSEINMDKMFFFSNQKFIEGQSIVIQFCVPKTFIINADVIYCRPFNIKSRIISQNNYTYRMLVNFTYLKEGERALLRQFIQSIEPDLSRHLGNKKGEEQEVESGELEDSGN